MRKSTYFLGFVIIFLSTICWLNLQANIPILQEEEVVEEEEFVENNERETINLTTLNKLMQSEEVEIIISDYEIINDESDDGFLIDKVFFSLYSLSQKNRSPKKVYFYNCKINLSENSPLVFSWWDFSKLNIVGCEFLSPIEFNNCFQISSYPTIIENCKFFNDVSFRGESFQIKSLKVNKNQFHTTFTIDNPIGELSIVNCEFMADSIEFSERDYEQTYYMLNLNALSIESLVLDQNTFKNNGIKNIFSINLEGSEINELTMFRNHLQTLNLSYAEVSKSLLIDSLYVENYIGILNFDFPESNTNVPWYNLGGEKFAIFHKEDSELIIPYQAVSDLELSNNLSYNDLISAYSKFNGLYHGRGDITSANGSYVEIKDIETRKQAHTQKINPSFNNLINYKLNVFLKFFSDYATNPGKSLIQSLWILMIFTVLYMFSFSRWDGMNYRYYLHQFSRFSEYITTDQPIDAVFTKEITLDNNDIQELRKKYQSEGKEMPRILKLFGGPLHFLGKFRYDIIPSLLKLFNFHSGSWAGIKTKSGKLWSGFLILLISSLFLIYVIIVKFLNSLVLSLNSFVVIGFGAMPEEDEWFAMYLSIIEGIVGWFLLTIFTITLLSQVLQSA